MGLSDYTHRHVVRKTSVCLLSVVLFLGASSSGKAEQTAPVKDNPEMFIAGMYLLESTTGITEKERVLRYRELEQLSGISGKKAIRYIESFRDHPNRFREIHDAMFELLKAGNEQPDETAIPISAHTSKR